MTARGPIRFGAFLPGCQAAKKRKSKPRSLEHAAQCALMQWADKARRVFMLAPDLSALDLLFAIPNAGGFSGGFKANVVRVANMRREGVKSGVPDLMLACPVDVWPGLFVEMKRPDGGSGASKEQRDFMENLRRVGYLAVVCNGFDEARTVIESYLQPLRAEKGKAA